MSNNSKNKSAVVFFNDHGIPISSAFDDIYFSVENGLNESQYVFLSNNDIPHRWQQSHINDFHIAETGFGTGLNFFVTWQLFNKTKKQGDRLIFTSFEKYPLKHDEIKRALSVWPELNEMVEIFLKQYPLDIFEDITLIFQEQQVQLNLIIGDVNKRIPELNLAPHNKINAWFLDGFAPSKNPDMWSQNLFNEMARLASDDCTVATFTAAGFVRRGLQSAGFSMKKQKGFGFKREMLIGKFQASK